MLKDKLKDYSIILASSSPRRQNLFKELDIPFQIDVKKIDEIFPNHLKAQEITEFLADLKSNAFSNVEENQIIITSDTIVWFENKAIGKPKNRSEAILMLKEMSGKQHYVYTSICIKGKSFKKIISDKTKVEFEMLTEPEINYYLDNFKPYDKAGSYGIQDWIGLVGVKKITGSYFNVMGLPVHKLYKELMNLNK